MRQPVQRRRGFTQIELLAVLAVGVVMLSLLMPALQQGRGKARTTGCKNNLKMIGISLHNYHDVHKTFPPGWIPQDRHSWLVALLPYMEQGALYNQMDFSNAPPADTAPISQTVLQNYLCSANRRARELNPHYGKSAEGKGYARSDYVGNHGAANGVSEEIFPGKQKRIQGLFGNASSVRIAHITDGTSNTLMVAERSPVKSHGAIWMRAINADATGPDGTAVLGTASEQQRLNSDDPDAFSSEHAGGVTILMGDGYVRLLSDKIDLQTFMNLAMRDDGNVLNLEEEGAGLPFRAAPAAAVEEATSTKPAERK